MTAEDPAERLAVSRREFGEWGGVNSSTEISTTFTGAFKGTYRCDRESSRARESDGVVTARSDNFGAACGCS